MTPPSERRVVWLIAAIQLVNILDFMMVMPLGPDFAAALDIPTSRLGLIAGAYTAAAAVAGAVGAWWFDRLDRRRALVVALGGLALGTLAGAFGSGLWSLFAARALAGTFGGPATSLSYAALTDAVPPERRGRAMGVVMSAFAVSSVLGVPLGLELARLGGWRAPFVAIAALCAVVTVIAAFILPPAPPARADLPSGRSTLRLLVDPSVALAMGSMAIAMTAHFAVVSNLAAWLQHNLGVPRDRLGALYLIGGVSAFLVLQVGGRLVDRFGASRVVLGGSALLLVVFGVGLLPERSPAPAWSLFVGLMSGTSLRNVAMNALSTRVPSGEERGRYMSVQSTTQHVASSLGAFWASSLLSERPDGGLDGIPSVARASMVGIVIVPILTALLARRLGPADGGAGPR